MPGVWTSVFWYQRYGKIHPKKSSDNLIDLVMNGGVKCQHSPLLDYFYWRYGWNPDIQAHFWRLFHAANHSTGQDIVCNLNCGAWKVFLNPEISGGSKESIVTTFCLVGSSQTWSSQTMGTLRLEVSTWLECEDKYRELLLDIAWNSRWGAKLNWVITWLITGQLIWSGQMGNLGNSDTVSNLFACLRLHLS